MKGTDSSIKTDPKTSTVQRKCNRSNEHENQSKPNVPPKPSRSRNIENNYNADHSDRSSSPKPLTASPPSSVDVYKPMPTAPVQNCQITPNGPLIAHVPNYENQSEFDRLQLHQQQNVFMNKVTLPVQECSPGSAYYGSPESGSAPGSAHYKDKKPLQQFSLKTWLKREREQVRKGVENDLSDRPSPESKPQSPPRPFARFKNSMIQKFASGSSSKKQDNTSKKSKDSKHSTGTSSSTNRHTTDNNVVHVPYDVIRNNYTSSLENKYNQPQLPLREYGALNLDSLEEYNRPIPDTVISPIDDIDCEDQVIAYQTDYEHRNINPPPIRVATEENVVHNSDVNNNDKCDDTFATGCGLARSRNSEMPYGRVQKDGTSSSLARDGNAFVQSPGVGQGAESKRVVAQTVPLYKARIINNYENQGKFESPHVVRQQAEPVNPVAFSDASDGYHGNSAIERMTGDHNSPHSRFGKDHQRHKSSDNTLMDNTHGGMSSNHQQSYSDNSPYGHHARIHNKGPDSSRNTKETVRKKILFENKNYFTPGNRAPMNVQSIGSLIDKFDKYNNNIPETQQASDQNVVSPSKSSTITPTPVAIRQEVIHGDASELSPPLPPRLNSSPSKSNTLSAQVELSNSYRNSSNCLSPDRQTYNSPHIRLENLTSSPFTPPSAYSTPQGNSGQHITTWSQNNNSSFYTPATSNASRSRNFHNSPQLRGNTEMEARETNTAQEQYTRANPLTNGYHNDNLADQSNDRDEGYRAKLRKAANNSQSTFDRYSKNVPQYTGRPSYGSPYTDTSVTTQYSSTTKRTPAMHNSDEVSYMAF